MPKVSDPDRLELVMHLRHRLDWPLSRIAQRLNLSRSAVSHLLKRASTSNGPIPVPRRRRVRAFSLSRAHNV